MCGPIALAIPVRRTSRFSLLFGTLVYNFGRMLAYALMGLVFGLVGKGFALAGWQNSLSIALGVMLLLALLLPASAKRPFRMTFLFRPVERIKSTVRKLFGTNNLRSLLLIGLLNGFLPCGLVYLGIAGSVATGDALKGALFMAAFGLGTFPAMMAVTLVRERISLRFRENIRRVVPVFVGIMAVLLILRGMNLGIPYISPAMETDSGSCHHSCCSK
jgi:sulfite exporter TauE/SafE